MKSKIYFLMLFILVGLGCSRLTEAPKVIWGSSIAALEKARDTASVKTYHCAYDECFNAIVDLGTLPASWLPLAKSPSELTKVSQSPEEYTAPQVKPFTIFQKDLIQGYIVVMGVPGNIDTTQVGIFLTLESNNLVQVEISSLSSSAREKVADIIFSELSRRFGG